MYSKKAIYFNYRSYGAFIALILFPATIVLIGGTVTVASLSVYPALLGMLIAMVIAFPGLPRLMAINANIKLKEDKLASAVRKTKRACRLLFVPVSVHIFSAYLLVLSSDFKAADEKLRKIENFKMSFSEKSKYLAVKTLVSWKVYGMPEEAMKIMGDINRKGADESIYYTVGKLMNSCMTPSKARKYNEEAFEFHTGNRDIMQNLVVSYCRTGQVRDAKILFRNLYNDMGATSDSLYYMAKIKEQENKKRDAVDFIKAALLIEPMSTNLIGTGELKNFLEDLQREEL